MKTSLSDDNEFARYLAQYLADNDYWVINNVIDQDVLYSVIKDFMEQVK